MTGTEDIIRSELETIYCYAGNIEGQPEIRDKIVKSLNNIQGVL